MYLARICGTQTQVYPLVGPHPIVAWRFWSYGRGAAAKADTELQAIVLARRELARAAMATLYSVAEQSKRVA